MKKIFFLLIILVSINNCTSATRPTEIENRAQDKTRSINEDKYCEKDSDCTKVCLDCCPCWNGAIALNKEYVKKEGINPESNCSSRYTLIGCPGEIKTAVCVNYTCTIGVKNLI